jgi:hypothetical protein
MVKDGRSCAMGSDNRPADNGHASLPHVIALHGASLKCVFGSGTLDAVKPG